MKLNFPLTTLCILFFCFNMVAQHEVDKSDSEQKSIGEVTINADSNINKLVKTKFSEVNKDNYKIQLYYGSLDKAHSVLSNFNSKFDDWPVKIEYETPNYKVWVGNFQTRLEADRALMKINKNFPHAFIFKPEK